MFDNLSDRLSQAARNLSGKGRLSESNIKDTLRQVRLALLEADVALPVVKSFIERIRVRAVGEEVGKSLTPGQALVKIIHNELVTILGSDTVPLDLRAQP
jgi:signal recognition particle subunit SRP54